MARAQAIKHGVTFAPPGTLATAVKLDQQHGRSTRAAADGQPGTVVVATTSWGGVLPGGVPLKGGGKETTAPILARALIVATVSSCTQHQRQCLHGSFLLDLAFKLIGTHLFSAFVSCFT